MSFYTVSGIQGILLFNDSPYNISVPLCANNNDLLSLQLTHDIIHEFAADNVKYLELRSTPKTIPETGLTPEVYLECMLRAVRDCEEGGVDTVVRILPSIDRRNGVDVAYKTVDLAYKYAQSSNGVVCGIDFSGDPLVSLCIKKIICLGSQVLPALT